MPKKATPKKTATKKNATTRKRVISKQSTEPGKLVPLSENQIRDRAYEIYRAGRNPSNPNADWLQAEQELRSELAS